MEYCMVCERIDWIKNGKNPYFVKELNTGYVVMGDYQRIKGYSLFLCKEHATELHFLEPEFRAKFLWEMSLVAEAVYRASGFQYCGETEIYDNQWNCYEKKIGPAAAPEEKTC